MAFPKIKQVRAFVVRGGGADYHDQGDGRWIGRLKLSALDKPGFGVELNREVKLHRPYPR